MALGSGVSGPSQVQSARERADARIATAMELAANAVGVNGRVIISRPVTTGAYVSSVVEQEAPATDAASGTAATATATGSDVKYISTRDDSKTPVSFEEAIMTGLALDGGLFVPNKVND